MREIDLNAPAESALPIHTFMLYGATRTGKTTFAGTMPRPLFLSDVSEKGFTSLAEANWDETKTPLFEPGIRPIVWGLEKQADMAECIAKAQPLIKAGRISTIAIDSATFYADLYLNIVLNAQKTVDNRQAYDRLGAHLRSIRIDIHNLGVNVVWLALEQAPDYDEENRLKYKGKPMIPGKQADKFCAGVDFIMRSTIDRPQPSKPPIFGLRSKEYANYIAGNRLGGRADMLPDPFVGTYASFMTALGYDVDKIRAALPKIGEVPKISSMPVKPPIAAATRPPPAANPGVTIRTVQR